MKLPGIKIKALFTALFLLAIQTSFSQVNAQYDSIQLQQSYTQKTNDLLLLGKVWGLLKYFHPQVAGGNMDWDKSLIDFLPGYINTRSKKERNDSLLAWIDRLGTIPAKNAGDYSHIKTYKLKPDFTWISKKNFGEALQNKLHYIIANRQQGDQYYIKFFRTEGLNIPVFQHEKSYAQNAYPTTEIRLIALYRFWNIIEYWYPYKYNLPAGWNTVLKEQMPFFIKAGNAEDYTRAIKRLLVTIHDGHGFLTSATNNSLMGNYYMPVRFKYVQKNIIVSSISNDSIAAAAGIAKGDIIESVDGIKANDIIQQGLLFTSGSNKAYQLYSLCLNLNRTNQPATTLQINNGKQSRKVTVTNFFTKKTPDQYISSFSYQKDSSLSLLKNNIAYLNMGALTMKEDSLKLLQLVEKSSAVIIDARQNAVEDPKRPNVLPLVEQLLCEGGQPYMFSTGQPDDAGVFKLVDNSSDSSASPFTPHPVKFNKPVVILINEEAMSIGEFMSMIFSKAPQAVLMGSATAGADGPASTFVLPGNAYVMFTGTGIYWADGRETQRVGIKPDIEVHPTIEGFRKNKDELLEKAIDHLSKRLP